MFHFYNLENVRKLHNFVFTPLPTLIKLNRRAKTIIHTIYK